MCGGQGLFEQKYIIHIKDVCNDEVGQETLFAFLKELNNNFQRDLRPAFYKKKFFYKLKSNLQGVSP
jgi:hypothetical protein